MAALYTLARVPGTRAGQRRAPNAARPRAIIRWPGSLARSAGQRRAPHAARPRAIIRWPGSLARVQVSGAPPMRRGRAPSSAGPGPWHACRSAARPPNTVRPRRRGLCPGAEKELALPPPGG